MSETRLPTSSSLLPPEGVGYMWCLRGECMGLMGDRMLPMSSSLLPPEEGGMGVTGI